MEKEDKLADYNPENEDKELEYVPGRIVTAHKYVCHPGPCCDYNVCLCGTETGFQLVANVNGIVCDEKSDIFVSDKGKRFEVPEEWGERIVEMLMKVRIKAWPVNMMRGYDGTFYELRMGDIYGGAKYRWWCDCLPETWGKLGKIANEILDKYIELRLASEDTENGKGN